ncbi:MAG: single-stranded-DNA-specific exonuclease RecJ [Clostridia bacterium]|nr:single-stranded-DNA-specific exonuclease RecJ [Clostridia bacterium]
MIRRLWLSKSEYGERLIGGFSPLISRLLNQRGIRDEIDCYAFFHPKEQALVSPFILPDMEKAALRIERAIRERETICVYGDYDADGTLATAILVDCLKALGGDVVYYIPSRHFEGYGMNLRSVAAMKERGIGLVVTVDNGISAFEEIRACYEAGMEVVITDHHKCHETLPECEAVVCVSREGYHRERTNLCGAGVAYKLAWALMGEAEATRRYLGLAALATVADVMPLTGENRTIVVRGMELIRENTGLNALLRAAGGEAESIDENTLAFVLAPRLNAAGRMGDAARAVELLLCRDDQRAEELAGELDEANRARREEEQRVLLDCERLLEGEKEPSALVLLGDDWNSGVVGIVASRLVERFGCPAILLTRAHDGSLCGSGRSVEGVDLFGMLQACSEYLTRFGGHAQAAGLNLERRSYEGFKKAFVERIEQAKPASVVYYDAEISLSDCEPQICERIESFAPFGEGNERPVFRLDGCTLEQIAVMGKDGKHLSAVVRQGSEAKRLVAFNLGQLAEEWRREPHCDLLFELRENRYRGRISCDLHYIARKT